MKTLPIPHTDLVVSRIALGCMQLGGSWDDAALSGSVRSRALRLVSAAVEQGINLFDHADIYTHGKSEAVFGDVLQQVPGLRQRIVIQSKCGIRFADTPNTGDPARYDFSHAHITASVEASLRRLRCDHLDILLLHRPDPLIEPEQVASAFDALHGSGKVRYFGVSNHNAGQIALLQRYLAQPLVINQLELSLLHTQLIDDGIMVNAAAATYAAASGTLDYCRAQELLIQAWSPLAGGALIAPPAQASPQVHAAAGQVAALADAHGTSREAIVLAWLLRHPAAIQPVVGTTKVDRLLACCQADAVSLSREDWYRLYHAARGMPLP
ncbi:MAG: aldo/keto reductase [Xanthomonadaceae bacterium]|nr:aldo/keto reductase [Xanthomonadaceae bacterium]MDP2185474.1 aldo/keto reductase [Xanthomonadales bacterium]MDZ4116714.1 aldo/keto reductase [Xanthomonadaceae bacterium]MDZ4379233.1 aldo/keto reductase [Xanthomonadaceae bacterium]